MKPTYTCKISGGFLAAIALAIAAIGFFQVRELLAALLIFSVLFCAGALAFFILFFIEEVAFKGVARFEAGVAHVRAWHSGALVQPGKDHQLRGSRWN